MDLPGFDRVAGNGFASVDAFLQFQRAAVAQARRQVEARAMEAWERLSRRDRDRFAAAAGDPGDVEATWRRAWWLWAIGGRPRAPFETGTSVEHADTLIAALRPIGAPGDLPPLFERWWSGLIEECRERLAGYVAARVGAAGRRLADEGLLPEQRPTVHPNVDTPAGRVVVADEDAVRAEPDGGSQPERLAQPTIRTLSAEGAALADFAQGAASRLRRQRRGSRASVKRVRAAEQESIAIHRRLDLRFQELGPVCGQCTRETGGCCTMTVPLLWREADFRLMALGGAAVPAPLAETAGACPFLGARGCRLESERRPHICRTFLCERAEAALGPALEPVRGEIRQLTAIRSQLG